MCHSFDDNTDSEENEKIEDTMPVVYIRQEATQQCEGKADCGDEGFGYK